VLTEQKREMRSRYESRRNDNVTVKRLPKNSPAQKEKKKTRTLIREFKSPENGDDFMESFSPLRDDDVPNDKACKPVQPSLSL